MRRLLLIGQMLYSGEGPPHQRFKAADLPLLTTTCFLGGPGALAVAASRSTIGIFSLAEILRTSSYVLVHVLVLVLVRESCVMMNYFLRASGRCRARAPLRAKPSSLPLYAPRTSRTLFRRLVRNG